MFSAFGNARQNGLTAFRFGSATVVQPGQIVYLRDLDTEETDSPGFTPFQREDADFRATYEPGVATFLKTPRRPRDGISSCSSRPTGRATSAS